MDDKWEVEKDSALLAILDASDGSAISVIRDGKAIGTLVPTPKRDVAKAREAADQLRALSVGLTLGPDLTITDLVREGRKY